MSRSSLAAGVRHLRVQLAAQQRREDSDEQLLHAFADDHDESAFAVLVRRHGPMVLHVCRRVLGHEQDAEDAFQAVFIVLARNGAALRNKASLASWLHGIAYRTALKAKQSAARRRKHEGESRARTQSRSPVDVADELQWREVRTLLDEEIARLPEKYRTPFILCHLEDIPQVEAARRLGVAESTMSNRLAEARKRLSQRLTRRGVELTALLAAASVATQTASALPAGLMVSTMEAALATAAGEGLTGIVSTAVLEMVKGAASVAMLSKAKMTALLLLSASLLAAAGAWTCRTLATPQPAQLAAEPGAPLRTVATTDRQALREDKSKDVAVSGRVVDPKGKPVRGAKLLLLYPSRKENLRKVWAISNPDGRFHFAVPRKLVETSPSKSAWENTDVMAAAEGYGFAVTRLGKPGASDLTLRLVKDDKPIRGRILDLQGKPVAGARVRIGSTLYMPKKDDLSAWIAAPKDPNKDLNSVVYAHLTGLFSSAFEVLFPPVTTGADGRFCIKGIGRERVAGLRIEGPTIATQAIHAMTRPCEAIHLPAHRGQPKRRTISYFGADFDLIAAPTRPVAGTVRDKDSGKPLPGVKIETELVVDYGIIDYLRTVTDKEGRYRLVGLPKGEGIKIVATTSDFPWPPENDLTKQPAYLSAIKNVGNPLGIGPVTVDFALKRGTWIKGHITDKSTGKAVQAHIEYFCFRENPNAKEVPFDLRIYLTRWTSEDGSFLIPALPGCGLIAVRASQDHYIMGVGAERIKERNPESQRDIFSTVPYSCYAGNFHALVEINPKPGEEAIACNVTLERGRSLKGTVSGSDGNPLAGASVSGLKDMGYWMDAGAEFTVESLQSNKPRVLQFVHKGKKLAGVLVLRGDEEGPISVRLQPWGALTGRLVSPRGEALTGMAVHCRVLVKRNGETLDTAALVARSDKEGRFRIEGLAPGLEYHDFHILKGSYLLDIVGGEPRNLMLKAGATKQLGDWTVKPME
jgi:RNA polymerase sigma factor (sigma-70 family)